MFTPPSTPRRLTGLSLALALAAAPALAGPTMHNADFESGQPGKAAPGWTLREISARQGFTALLTDQNPAGGKKSLELACDKFLTFGPYGAVSQSVPAHELRGKRVRFRAKVRTSGLANFAAAGLFARVHRPDFRPGHCAEMNDRPERGKKWVERSVVVDVAADAERLEVGFVLHMAGTSWFDDATLEVLGPAGAGNTRPGPLTERGQANLTAFARLLAYVRFFHPSDESAVADWGRFAVGHVADVEVARSPEELAFRLMEVFAPIAPTLRTYVTGQPQPAVPALAAPPEGMAVRVLAWRHLGSNPNGLHGHYRSERVADCDLPGAALLRRSPEPLPRPADVYEVDLGGDVSCRLPLALYADAKGTLPRADGKLKPSVKPVDFPPTGDDRDTRLACVCLAWGVLQHFYPYFEETRADWPNALREALASAATDADAAAFYRTMCRLIARLEDSHGSVRPGSGAPRYDGALPLSWDVVEGKLAVTWVDPVAKLRIKVGDVVKSIDGTPAAVCVNAAERLASGATPGHRRYRTCAGLRMGPVGQPVTLALSTPAGTAYRLTLRRAPADDSPLRGPSMREPRLERFARPAPGVIYLDLDRYKDEDLHKVLADVKNADGVVFDIRGYPLVGMYLLRLFAPRPWVEDRYSDVITLRPDRRGVKLETYRPPVTKPVVPPWKVKVAFLTDGRAVSYAETFLAVADNTKIGTIVGEPTAGSNGGIALYVLPDGTRVSWTGQKAVRADGSRLHGVGIQPAVTVRRTLKGLAEGRDESLDKAIELVRPPG